MRLNEYQQKVIRTTVAELFGPQADVWLFGSRVDDQAKGGDIDLLIRLDTRLDQSERALAILVARLQQRLGDQPIDVLLLDPSTLAGTIHTEALQRGVRLCVMPNESALALERFLQTLEIVYREGKHLAYSWGRLYSEPIDVEWTAKLEEHPELAERLEAFLSRFGRMQDTMGGKLLPRWLSALAEVPGSQIETLNRAERLGVLDSAEQWLAARYLRNRLIQEYMDQADTFTEDLLLAKEYSGLLIDTYNNIREYARTRMDLDATRVPGRLSLPSA